MAAANQRMVEKEHAHTLVDREKRTAAALVAAAAAKCKQHAVAHGVQHGTSLTTATNQRKGQGCQAAAAH